MESFNIETALSEAFETLRD